MPRQKKLENTTFGNQVTRLLAPAKAYERIERLPGTNLPDSLFYVVAAQAERAEAIDDKLQAAKAELQKLRDRIMGLKTERAAVVDLMQALDAAEYRKAFKDELRHQGASKMTFDGEDLNAADGYVFSNLDAHAACGYNDYRFCKERRRQEFLIRQGGYVYTRYVECRVDLNKRYTEEYLDLIHTARSVTVCCKQDCDVCHA